MKVAIRIGLLMAIIGLLFCFGAMMNISDTATRTFSSSLIESKGQYNSLFYFTSKQYDIKVIIPDDSEAEFNIYDSHDIVSSSFLPKPVLSEQLDSTSSFSFTPHRRGFYAIQLINKQMTEMNYEISAYRSSGLQRDFLTEAALVTVVGLIVFFLGILLHTRTKQYGLRIVDNK